MIFKEYIRMIKSDLHRYNPREDMPIYTYLHVPGFRYSCWLRTSRFLKSHKGIGWFVLYALARYQLRRYEYRFGISIPYNTAIGPGFYIGHYGGIVVSCHAQIGKNCNINHGVTVGTAYGGKSPGTPVIKDGVYIGPGAKVIGGIIIGNNVAIGANCVVTQSMLDNAVVVGVPGKVSSYKGAGEYVINKV